MIKAKGKEALSAESWKYITALTNAQVRAILKEGVLQPDLLIPSCTRWSMRTASCAAMRR